MPILFAFVCNGVNSLKSRRICTVSLSLFLALELAGPTTASNITWMQHMSKQNRTKKQQTQALVFGNPIMCRHMQNVYFSHFVQHKYNNNCNGTRKNMVKFHTHTHFWANFIYYPQPIFRVPSSLTRAPTYKTIFGFESYASANNYTKCNENWRAAYHNSESNQHGFWAYFMMSWNISTISREFAWIAIMLKIWTRLFSCSPLIQFGEMDL